MEVVVFAQTIALIRFQLSGILDRRFWLLLLALLLVSLLVGRFAADLSLVEGDAIALAVQAEFLRYSLWLLLSIQLSVLLADAYASGQMERSLAMPISRAQYLLALLAVELVLICLLAFSSALLLGLYGSAEKILYWAAALFLEGLLLAQFCVLAILSLRRLTPALMLTLAFYLLARAAPLIDLILSRSAQYYEDEAGFQLGRQLFALIRYLLPSADAFARNDALLTAGGHSLGLLPGQLAVVAVYLLLLLAVSFIDFYRKEFGRG